MNLLLKNLKTDQKFLISQTISFGLVLCSLFMIKILGRDLPNQVPLFFTRTWGEGQLAPKVFLYLIPIAQTLFSLVHLLIINASINKRKNEYATIFNYLNIFVGFLITAFLLKIVANLSFFPYNKVDARFINILFPFLISFLISVFSGKYIIKLARKLNIVTNPNTDSHPAMLIKTPIPRAGVLIFYAGFIITSLIFLPLNSKRTIGILIGTSLMTLLGVLDDKYKDINRYIRLGAMAMIAAIPSLFGVIIFYLNNPFNGPIKLDSVVFKFSAFSTEHKIYILAVIFSIMWMLWIMNTLSWSNGIDGQFSGIAGIAALTIAILSLRFAKIDQENINTATLSVITAGAVFGTTLFTWYPQKILWGFGATAVGLVLASTALLSVSKVAIASLVLLIPLMDGAVAIVRRVSKGKSPFYGDREHLHHKLLNMGWSKPQVALFYWVITAALGICAIVSSGKNTILTVTTFGGIVGFVIILFNLFSVKKGKE
ncbi:undecaprenyl/decaprenyl-phosphate alpha-N-acetylglucosaminyl 1-phosphate transferase [Patescibacteria group bacterium]|nr:undecaprenyl/decaprenyl-phosphate alpha-N-acetylglucosaminyl 1-phosphate transferase [Patescibacteria group bacterium]